MRVSILAALALASLSPLVLGCEGADLGDCPSNSAAAEAQGQKIVQASCNYCHGTMVTGAARQDAPADLNFDDLAVAKAEAEEMYSEAESGAMPPRLRSQNHGRRSGEHADLARLRREGHAVSERNVARF